MTVDHSKRALDRIAFQYRNGDKFRQWIDTLPNIAQDEIELPAETLAEFLRPNDVDGELLNIIGRIVGVGRGYRADVREDSTQFDAAQGGETQGAQFGAVGVQFEPEEQVLPQTATDNIYRLLILARIERNNGDATINNIVNALRRIVSGEAITVIDNQDMTFRVSFGFLLTQDERFILEKFDVLPRPQGVEFVGFSEAPAITQFGASIAEWGDARASFNGTTI